MKFCQFYQNVSNSTGVIVTCGVRPVGQTSVNENIPRLSIQVTQEAINMSKYNRIGKELLMFSYALALNYLI